MNFFLFTIVTFGGLLLAYLFVEYYNTKNIHYYEGKTYNYKFSKNKDIKWLQIRGPGMFVLWLTLIYLLLF